MSIDRSLKIKGALVRHRNVLSRTERIVKLKDEEKWHEGDSAYGLPKVGHRKSHAGKKEKAALKEAAAVGAEGVAATAEAPAAEPKKGEAKKPQAQKADAKKPQAQKPEADKKADKKK
jgi:small basic protein (TIGR04137 family)